MVGTLGATRESPDIVIRLESLPAGSMSNDTTSHGYSPNDGAAERRPLRPPFEEVRRWTE